MQSSLQLLSAFCIIYRKLISILVVLCSSSSLLLKDSLSPFEFQFAYKLELFLLQPYVLECYRRWEQKRRLLLEVVALHDGNAILTVSSNSVVYTIIQYTATCTSTLNCIDQRQSQDLPKGADVYLEFEYFTRTTPEPGGCLSLLSPSLATPL